MSDKFIETRFALWGVWSDIVAHPPTDDPTRLNAFVAALRDYAENINAYLDHKGRTDIERGVVAFELSLILTFIEKSPNDERLVAHQPNLEMALRKAVPTLRTH